MFWGGTTNTNSLWEADEWAGRIREEDAEPIIATAPSKTPSTVAKSVADVTITESVTSLLSGDSFSATHDNSTTTNSNIFSRIPIIQSSSVEDSQVILTTAISENALSETGVITNGNISTFIPLVGTNVGRAVAEPIISSVPANSSIGIGVSTSSSIDESQLLPIVPTNIDAQESTFVDIDAVVQEAAIDTIFSDELSIVGDTAKLSVSATSDPVTISETAANELLSVKVSAVTTTNNIADIDDTTVSFSDDIKNITVADSSAETSVSSTISVDSADILSTKSIVGESFEIYSAIEDAILVTSAGAPIRSKNLLTVSPDGIVSAIPEVLISDSQQINSSIDYTEIENETNIVTLEPSANEVIIDE